MHKAKFECRRGSLTIRGTEYRLEGENLPIAIICHGFMANQGTVRRYARALAEMGYAAYCFDFCGGCVIGGKSDGKTTDMSVLSEVADLITVIAHTKSLPYTDAARVTLMGCSQGGFVAALTAARLKSAVSRLILFYPALCIPDDARAGKMMFARFDPTHIPETFRCGPMKLGRRYAADVLDMDPFAEISPYQGPVMIVHGDRDAIVDISYAERANKAYIAKRTASAPVKLVIIKGAGHGFSRKADKLALESIRKFAVI